MVAALGLAALAVASLAWGRPRERAAIVPKLGELNRYVVAVLETYPTDGTHPYNWPRDGSYAGVTEDLVYEGEVVAQANGKGEAYCCGLTFEVLFKAWALWAKKKRLPFRIGDLDAKGLKALRSDWYCCGGVRSGPVEALVSRGLGVRIDKPGDARPGDFVQLWRTSGSGHSVVFIAWERDRKGRITAMRYWSTQPATRGIGCRTERTSGEGAVDLEETFIARVGVPPGER